MWRGELVVRRCRSGAKQLKLLLGTWSLFFRPVLKYPDSKCFREGRCPATTGGFRTGNESRARLYSKQLRRENWNQSCSSTPGFGRKVKGGRGTAVLHDVPKPRNAPHYDPEACGAGGARRIGICVLVHAPSGPPRTASDPAMSGREGDRENIMRRVSRTSGPLPVQSFPRILFVLVDHCGLANFSANGENPNAGAPERNLHAQRRIDCTFPELRRSIRLCPTARSATGHISNAPVQRQVLLSGVILPQEPTLASRKSRRPPLSI